MFDSSRYVTQGIAEQVGLDLQFMLWQLIDTKRKQQDLDYLQVFELSVLSLAGRTVQKVVHRQEQPEFEDIHYLTPDSLLTKTIWVIDSGTYATMLFPSEY